jgi:nitronate monooxygenase
VAPAAKARVVGASGDDPLRTRVFDIARGYDWPTGYTGRALLNQFSRSWHRREDALIAARAGERRRYAAAAAAGDVDTALVFAGEGSDLIRDIEPAEIILNRIVAAAEAALARRFG